MSDLEDYPETDTPAFELAKPNFGVTTMQTTNENTQATPPAVGTPVFNLRPGLAVLLTVIGVGLSALNTITGLPLWVYSVLQFVLPLGSLLGIWSAGPRIQAAQQADSSVPAPKPSV